MGLAAVPALRQGRVRPQRLMRAQFLWLGVMSLILGLGARLGSRRAAAPPQWLARRPGVDARLGWLAAAGAFADARVRDLLLQPVGPRPTGGELAHRRLARARSSDDGCGPADGEAA